MRAIEDDDLALGRYLGVDAPEVVARQFALGWGLEPRDPDAGRVDAGENLADRTVLATGVHRLQNDQQAVGGTGEQPLLQVDQLVTQLFGGLTRVPFVAVEPRCLVARERLENVDRRFRIEMPAGELLHPRDRSAR